MVSASTESAFNIHSNVVPSILLLMILSRTVDQSVRYKQLYFLKSFFSVGAYTWSLFLIHVHKTPVFCHVHASHFINSSARSSKSVSCSAFTVPVQLSSHFFVMLWSCPPLRAWHQRHDTCSRWGVSIAVGCTSIYWPKDGTVHQLRGDIISVDKKKKHCMV